VRDNGCSTAIVGRHDGSIVGRWNAESALDSDVAGMLVMTGSVVIDGDGLSEATAVCHTNPWRGTCVG